MLSSCIDSYRLSRLTRGTIGHCSDVNDTCYYNTATPAAAAAATPAAAARPCSW